ncbi:MAG: glycosyltransferase family 2 protein [Candidatus Omnitrophica bacterium]|nr:glycosyltransferase family 2 protein [Candidatus Omnitrophota bacterium]
MKLLLSIAIPTYNRADKLKRLLKILENQIVLANLVDQIEVLVSDNASIDDTYNLMMSVASADSKINYFRQPKNLGFDANCRFLYEKAQADYVWFFADDDIPLPSALSMILQGLRENNPDVLIFSFEQPIGAKIKAFNFLNKYEIITRPKIIIELLSISPKISTYVLRKISLNAQQLKELEPFMKNGFFFIDLAFSVIHASKHPKLCVVSQPLASCDEDYMKFTFDPKLFFEVYKIFYHPFVLKYLPGLAERKKDRSYCDGMQFIFAAKMGTLITSKPELLDSGFRDAGIRVFVLLKNPKTLIQMLLIKMNLIKFYKIIKPFINLIKN